jgi:hypothetical protein
MTNATLQSKSFRPAVEGGLLRRLVADLFAVTPLAIVLKAMSTAPKATR